MIHDITGMLTITILTVVCRFLDRSSDYHFTVKIIRFVDNSTTEIPSDIVVWLWGSHICGTNYEAS